MCRVAARALGDNHSASGEARHPNEEDPVGRRGCFGIPMVCVCVLWTTMVIGGDTDGLCVSEQGLNTCDKILLSRSARAEHRSIFRGEGGKGRL